MQRAAIPPTDADDVETTNYDLFYGCMRAHGWQYQ